VPTRSCRATSRRSAFSLRSSGSEKARARASCQIQPVRRRRAWAFDQAADPRLRAARRRGSADLWHRHQGAVGYRPRTPRAWPRDPHPGLAAERDGGIERWRFSLSPGQRPGRARLRHLAELHQSASVAVPRDAALEDASSDCGGPRGRQARLVRCACHQRRRVAGGAEARVSGRRADRRLRRLPQRAADQGHAHLDEKRHARCRSRVRRNSGRPRRRRAHGLSRSL